MKPRIFRYSLLVLIISSMLIFIVNTTQSAEGQDNTTTPKSLYEQRASNNASLVPSNELRQSSSTWAFQEVYSFDLAEFWCENNIAVGDFDRDGLMDIILLATTTYQTEPPYEYVSKAILLHNEGNWQFGASIIAQYPVDSYGFGVEVADLNSDGWDDFALREQWTTHIFLNNQSGGFTETWTGAIGAFGGLDLVDVNNDTYADVLSGIQSGSGAKIEVFLNNGSGTSVNKAWESPLYGGSAGVMQEVFSTNSDGDDNADIAALASQVFPDLLTIFSGDGTGTSFSEETVLDLGDRAYSLAVGKINNDDLTDLATHVGQGQVRVFQAQANSTITESWQSPDLDQMAFNLALEDFDQDGFDDIFAGTFRDGAMRIYRNDPGSSSFELAWSGYLPGFGYAGTVADLDNDGYPDLIVGEQNANEQNTIRILHRVPILNINYTDGAPGSFFNLSGSSFPPNQSASITINGLSIGNLATDTSGTFTFTLTTSNADEGSYYVTASVNPNATVRFTLDNNSEIKPQEGSYTTFDVPSGTAFTHEICLPIVLR